MTTRKEPPALTVAEAAAQLHCHPVTIYRAVRLGHLPAARVGRLLRISPADVADLFQTTTEEPPR